MRRTDLLTSAGSQAATNEAGNKVVTVGHRTHVTWQDVTPEGYFNRVRTLDLDSGDWSETYTLGSAYDDHARAVMIADSDGFLHAILSGHNTPCTYRRSRTANDAADWTDPVPVADGTYPYLVCGPGDDLYLTVRNAERWNGVELYTKPNTEPWRHVGKVIERLADYPGYAAFHCGFCFGGDGVLHLVSDFYEGYGIYDQRGIHQAVAYLQSPDGGRTWRTCRGEPAATPARPCSMDVICQSTGLRHEPMPPPVLAAQGNIAVDPDGIPHVLYLYHLNHAGELILASPDDQGIWRQRSIDALGRAYPHHRASICRGAFTIDGDGVLRALVTLTPAGHSSWAGHLPSRAGLGGLTGGAVPEPRTADDNPVVWLTSTDGGTTFSVREALSGEEGARSPKYELPVSGGPARQPEEVRAGGILYFDRSSYHLPGFPEDGGYQNGVYYRRDSAWGAG